LQNLHNKDLISQNLESMGLTGRFLTASALTDIAASTSSGGTSVNVLGGSIPGKSSKQQTISAYILKGVAQLLATGEPTFDDKSARKLCEDLGCYSVANHALYMNSMGNSITGSKDKGWKLTAPGLKKGADLIKEMTKGA
jgi:hypothetical protein